MKPLVRRLGWAAIALAATCVLLGYRHSDRRWCSGCWAGVQVREWGLAVTPEWRSPFTRSTSVWREPPRGVLRFLPPGHVHDAAGPSLSASMSGPFLVMGALWCGRHVPSNFALALDEEAFADHVAARVADGSIALEDVRALIRAPHVRSIDDWADSPERRALLVRGNELYADFLTSRPADPDDPPRPDTLFDAR